MLDYIFPRHCVLCKALSHSKIDLCEPCKKELPYVLTENNPLAIFYYQAPIDQMLIKLKFGQQLNYAETLGNLAALRMVNYYLTHPKPQLIIPVPLHRKRLKERGYNQALELARPIAKKLQLPIDKHSIERIKHTKPQSELTATERLTNLKHAFSIVKPIVGARRAVPIQHVLLFDDVVTTGSTMRELCVTLQQSGIQQIDMWCIAKTKICRGAPVCAPTNTE